MPRNLHGRLARLETHAAPTTGEIELVLLDVNEDENGEPIIPPGESIVITIVDEHGVEHTPPGAARR